MSYKPEPKRAAILDRAFKHIESVPYKVTLRWVFYRLLQDGVFGSKADYRSKDFKDTVAKARKEFYGGWRPWTLADDRWAIEEHIEGQKTAREVKGAMASYAELLDSISHHYKQAEYCEVWFEANAMYSQFAYYTHGLTLMPFGGDCHIVPKWEAAKRLAKMGKLLGKPVRILYFGDLDKKIPESAMDDVRPWCYELSEYKVIPGLEVCGLNEEQIRDFAARGEPVPEDPVHPGNYQWEALTDAQAREIIEGAMALYVDQKAIERAEKATIRLKKKWEPRLKAAIEAEVAKG
jgi:hypothetical protein